MKKLLQYLKFWKHREPCKHHCESKSYCFDTCVKKENLAPYRPINKTKMTLKDLEKKCTHAWVIEKHGKKRGQQRS